MKEEELALYLVKHFEKLGYEVYKEVLAFGSGSARADLYCVKGDESIAVETKMGIGLKALEQSFEWRELANYSLIALPYKHKANLDFAVRVCRDYGIGILYYYTKNDKIVEFLKPVCNFNPVNPTLYEEQKDSIAGNARSEYVTPFKLTCKQLIDHVISKNGKAAVKEAIRSIKHHYAHDDSAEQNLKLMVKTNVLKNLSLVKEGKFYFFVYIEL